jgi:3'-5' exoribonuclease
MISGVLFHDCGKLWENTYPETGFSQLHLIHGEMLGHIPLGLELVNKLWRDLPLGKLARNRARKRRRQAALTPLDRGPSRPV